MKKILAMLLALCMIMSCMTLVVSAAEGEEEHVQNEIVIDAPAGDGNSGEHVENTGVLVSREITAGDEGKKLGVAEIAHFNWYSKDAKIDDLSFDITGMEYVEFELYVSRADALTGVPFCFELTSGGICDKEEDSFIEATEAWMMDKDGNALKDGWNTIRVPLSKFPAASADRTRINCFRIFNNGEVNLNANETYTIQMKSFGFGTEADGIVHAVPFDSDYGVGGGDMLDHKASNVTTLAAPKVDPGAFMVTYTTEEPMDLSTYKYVDITMKVSNPEAFKQIKFEIELTSSGECDVEENNYTGFFDNPTKGWNTFRIPLSAFNNRKEADLTKINYIRFYSIGTEADRSIDEDVTIEFTKFRFSDAGNVNFKDYSWSAGKEAALPEGVTLVSEKNFGENDNCIFADKTTEIIYKVELDTIDPSWMYLELTTGGRDLLLQVGDKNKADAYKTIVDTSDEEKTSPTGHYVINIASYMPMSALKAVGYVFYIRVADVTTEDGSGGQITKASPVTLSVGYSAWEVPEGYVKITEEMIIADEEEMMANEHSIPLFGCNKEIGGFKVDYDDFKGGSSSLAYTLGTWTEVDKTTDEEIEKKQDGQSGFTFKTIDYAGEESIDASGMDTLEFWFYCSNREALNAAGFADNAMELTSAGTCDKEETCWRLTDILGQCTQDGWNEIRLPITGNATDWTRLNYMRWYFISASNLPAEPVIIKIDNIRLTDYVKQQQELQKPIAEAMAAKIEEKVGSIPKFDDEDASIIAQYEANKDAWQALYDELNEELTGLNSVAQDLVSDLGAKKTLGNIRTWLRNYNNYVEDLANNPPAGGDENPPVGGDENPPAGGDDDKKDEKKGCGSMITVGAGAMMVLAAAWVTMAARKKED